MEIDTQITRGNFRIYFNQWGEYCVCHPSGGMVSWNAGFLNIKTAKAFIDRISSDNLDKRWIEETAEKMRGRGNPTA